MLIFQFDTDIGIYPCSLPVTSAKELNLVSSDHSKVLQ